MPGPRAPRAAMRATALAVVLLAARSAAADPVGFDLDGARLLVDPASLSITIDRGSGPVPLAAPAFADGRATAPVAAGEGASWTVTSAGGGFDVSAAAVDGALRLEITADRPATLAWPVPADDAPVAAYALPLGDGRFVPARDQGWIDWLSRTAAGGALAETLSMPFWTTLDGAGSVTWIAETPFDGRLEIHDAAGRLVVGLTHRFSPLAPHEPYVVRIVPGPPDPIAGALAYRALLQGQGALVDLTAKIARVPAVAALGGAPHIYLWSDGLLKPGDVRAWPAFVKAFDAARADDAALAGRLWRTFDADTRAAFAEALGEARQGYVSQWVRPVIVSAINAGLRTAVPPTPVDPVAGGHDPAADAAWALTVRAQLVDAFGTTLAAPETWGGGLSTGMIQALYDAGLERAWLGAPDWEDALLHPEAVAAAKAAGFLVGAYDSYGSAHPADLAETWPTAQMGDALAATAGVTDAEGRIVRGFGDKGVYTSTVATNPYARERIARVVRAAGLDSYFLDVDGTGLLFEDHTPGRETTEAADAAARRDRLAYASQTLGLVLGTEGGASLFAPAVDFAHGMTTTPFAWVDPDIGRNRDSDYFRGGYWPPYAPALFFETVPLKPSVRPYTYDPAFRLPLYEVALHDSVVTTHHWEYGSLKFRGERATTGLLQLLWMVPPLYHLSAATLDRDLPAIAAYDAVFRPLHARLFTVAMTDFEALSADRLVQRTRFADGTRITVNFGTAPATVDGTTVPGHGALIEPSWDAPHVVAMDDILPE